VVDNYIWRAPDPSRMFKVVAQPSKIYRLNNHNHEYLPGFFAVDESNEMVSHNTSHKGTQTAEILRINHYRAKSSQHTRARLERALLPDSFHRHDHSPEITQDTKDASRLEQVWRVEEEESNDTRDSSASRFLPCVRQGLLSRGIPPLSAWITLSVDDSHRPENVRESDTIRVSLAASAVAPGAQADGAAGDDAGETDGDREGEGKGREARPGRRHLRVWIRLWGPAGHSYRAVLWVDGVTPAHPRSSPLIPAHPRSSPTHPCSSPLIPAHPRSSPLIPCSSPAHPSPAPLPPFSSSSSASSSSSSSSSSFSSSSFSSSSSFLSSTHPCSSLLRWSGGRCRSRR
jgi:hypothetical protein